MTLNGIDVSGWQTGINLYAVPADFVIVKATENTNYISPAFRPQADATLGSGKLLGIYHYVGGIKTNNSNEYIKHAQAEADYFVNAVKPYVGKAVLALDFESGQNASYGDTTYLKYIAQAVYNSTGVRPLLYGSQSDYNRLKAVGDSINCGLWIAQYPNYKPTGYQGKPWNEGAYSCAIRQYASTGRLPGYGGNLDLNKFYGDANAWKAYAKSDKAPAPAPIPTPAPAPAKQPTPSAISPITKTSASMFNDIAQFSMHIPWGVDANQQMQFARVGNIVTVNGCGVVNNGGGSWLNALEYVPEGFRPITLSVIRLSGSGTGTLMVRPDGSICWDGDGKYCFTHANGTWITKDKMPK